MSGVDSRRSPLVWHPEWPALLGWLFVAALVCLLYDWFYAVALPVLLGLLILFASVGGYLSSRNQPDWHSAWQQRLLWTDLTSVSQTWILLVYCLVPPEPAVMAPGGISPWQQRLLYRHLAWLQTLRLHRAGAGWPRLASAASFLEPAEAEQLRGADDPPTQLLARQATALRQLHQDGVLTGPQLAALRSCLEKMEAMPGATPPSKPPRRSVRWVSWTWLHAALLTGLLASLLVTTGAYSVWWAMPLTGLFYWIMATLTHSASPNKAPADEFSPQEDYPAAVCRRMEADVRKIPVMVATSLWVSR